MDIHELIEETKYEQGITSSDLMKALEDIDYDIEDMEKLFENFEGGEGVDFPESRTTQRTRRRY